MPTTEKVLIKMCKPLTHREISLYRAVFWLTTLLWIGALLFYFLIGYRAVDVTFLEICFFSVNTVVMFSFGTSLRAGTRIIYGVPWLLDDPTGRKKE